jgi:uncharacterized alpha-E superfamily protein
LDYRRTVRTSINGAKAATFLMSDPCFPRTLAYCFGQIGESATKLPRADLITTKIDKILKFNYPITSSEDLDEGFHNHLNEIQIAIIEINQQITENWFQFRQGDAA